MAETEPRPDENSPIEPEDLTADETSLENNGNSQDGGPDHFPQPGDEPSPPPKISRWQKLLSKIKLNIYLILFILLLVLAGIIALVAYRQSTHGPSEPNIASGKISESSFKDLANSSATIGTSNQLLNIQSNAVFAGKVLLRQGLEVAGNLQVGGTLALNDLTVGGTAQLGQAQVNKNLVVAGTTSLQGSVSIAKSLQVSGGANFGGSISAPQITTSSLQLGGDLALSHHITTGGANPGKSNGGALGSGGTASVSGSDTAGSININTGSGPAAGCFITVNFTAKYNSPPHVLVTPVGSSAGGLSYYINRTSSNFSVCDATAPPAGASFGFDYFVID